MANTVITVNPETGTTTNASDLEITHGNHDHMPPRTSAYEPTDEKGHNNASSLGGSNNRDNVFPQSKDLNHGSYLQMEKGEKDVLQAQGNIHSEKTAFISNQPGGRPDAFMVNDHITYANGVTQDVHHSFTNLTNAQQESINASLQGHTDMLNAPNPGDTLRDHMSPADYAHVMEETDASLPGIRDTYDGNWISNTPAGPNTASGNSFNTVSASWSFDAATGTEAVTSTPPADSSWSFETSDTTNSMDTSDNIFAEGSFTDSGVGFTEAGTDIGGSGLSDAHAEGAAPGDSDDGGAGGAAPGGADDGGTSCDID